MYIYQVLSCIIGYRIIYCMLDTITYALKTKKGNSQSPVAEFIDPWLGDKVNSGIGLSYRHARLHSTYAVPSSILDAYPCKGQHAKYHR
jgi:hypothetical protein